MKRLFTILLFLCALSAQAASRVEAWITITNTPTGNTQTLVWNSSITRTWTNYAITNLSSLIQTTNAIDTSRTNLLAHLNGSTLTNGYSYALGTNTNTVVVYGLTNDFFSLTIGGLWGYVTYYTNPIYGQSTYSTPYTAVNSNQFRIWQQSIIATNLGYSTQAIANVGLRNFWGSNFIGTNVSFPGTGANSLQIGQNAQAAASDSFTVGNTSTNTANASASVIVGHSGVIDAANALLVGNFGVISNTGGIVIGTGTVTNDYVVIIAPLSGGTLNTASFGPMAANQVWLGTASESVWIPGATHFQKSLFFTNAWATNINVFAGSVSNVTLTNVVWLNGYLGGLTNGQIYNVFATNLPSIEVTNLSVVSKLTATNATIDGLTATNFNAPGSGTSSQRIGLGATASGTESIALGVGSYASSNQTVAIGYAAGANSGYGIALGWTAVADGEIGTGTGLYNISIGKSSYSSGGSAMALGYSVNATNATSVALGAGAGTTAANQIRLGTSAEHVSIPGRLLVEGSATNLTLRGTNVINARLDFTPRSNSGLANGNNSGVVLGTNVYIRLSGPSGAYTNAGFASEQDGSYHILQFDNPANNMTILNDSGLEATAANRVLTTTGGPLNFTNNPVMVPAIYDGSVSRWRLLHGMPYR